MRNDIEIRKLFADYSYCLDNILQRPYEWERERVVKLIHDICSSSIICDNGGIIRYNVGDFITYSGSGDIAMKYLFDGQQRITTLTLLFANIYHHNPSRSVKQAIGMLLYVTSIDAGGGYSRVKRLNLRREDDVILGKIIAGGIDCLTKEERKSCLAKNYDVISREFTDGMSEGELDSFYSTIMGKASYFERECESRQEGIRQFNNLNGWQQSLKRSRLGIATLYSIFRDNNGRYDDSIEEFLCSLSNMNDQDAKEFLALFIYYKGGDYKENGFPAAFESLVKDGIDVVGDASKFYNTTYQEIISGRGIFGNPMLRNTTLRQVYVDLFTDKNEWADDITLEKKIEVYKKCEWGYISNIVLNAGTMIRDKFKGILPSYCSECGDIVDYVVRRLTEKRIFMPADGLLDYSSTKNEFFTRILLRVEDVYGEELNRREPVRHIDAVSAEHIHPQKPRKGCEYHCDGNLTYTIGNFTLMGKNGNGSNSNKVFCEKKELYGISPYLINSKHLYCYEDWNDDTIRDNAKWHIERIRRFYGID